MTTLVFLHGIGGGHAAWNRQVPFFEARGYRCLAWDAPGCAGGATNNPGGGLTGPGAGPDGALTTSPGMLAVGGSALWLAAGPDKTRSKLPPASMVAIHRYNLFILIQSPLGRGNLSVAKDVSH